jgi:hypothetical protein
MTEQLRNAVLNVVVHLLFGDADSERFQILFQTVIRDLIDLKYKSIDVG